MSESSEIKKDCEINEEDFSIISMNLESNNKIALVIHNKIIN